MTMNKDDDREVGWSPRQIRKLSADLISFAKGLDAVSEDLAGTDRAVDRINGRLTALEGAWADEVPGRMGRLEDLVSELDDRVSAMTPYVELAERVTALEEQDHANRKAIVHLEKRAGQAREGVASLSDQGNADRDRVNQLMSAFNNFGQRLADLENKRRHGGLFEAMNEGTITTTGRVKPPVDRLGDFTDWERGVPGATPDGGVAPMESQTPSGRMNAAAAVRQESYNRGYSAGLAAAQQDGVSLVKTTRDHTLGEVELRVRAFMSDHFSTATIDEITAVIRAAR